MRIDELTLQNFKGFEEKTIRFESHFNVLIGENGTGKTAVLDALAVAMGSFLLGIDRSRAEARSIGKHEIRLITTVGQPKPQLPVVIAAKGKVAGKEIDWVRNIDEITRKTTTKFKGAVNIKAVAASLLQESRKKKEVILPILVYHGTGRLWAQHETPNFVRQEEGVLAGYNRCLSAKSSSKAFLGWYKTLEDEWLKFKHERERLQLAAFKKTITALVNNWEDIAYSRREEDMEGTYTDAAGNKHRLGYKQLSDGYRNIIGLAADIAYRCIQLNPHLGENAVEQTPGIVLIDELDMHLHPNWQRHIVSHLKEVFPNIQFIATTHSPFIVQSLAANELISLDRLVDDAAPKDLALDDVIEDIMGVDSLYGIENKEQEAIANRYLEIIYRGGDEPETREILRNTSQDLEDLEDKIADPAMRAFLQMKKLSQEK